MFHPQFHEILKVTLYTQCLFPRILKCIFTEKTIFFPSFFAEMARPTPAPMPTPTPTSMPTPTSSASSTPKPYRPLVKDFDLNDDGFDLSKVKIEKGVDRNEVPQPIFVPPSFQQRRAHLQKSTISLTPAAKGETFIKLLSNHLNFQF